MAATIQASPRSTSATSAWSKFSHWLADRRNRYVVLGGVVAVVALVTWVVLMSGRRKEAFAGRALDQATDIAESGNLPLAASELQKVITTYGGTKAAQEAVIRLNQVRLVNGQYELAAVGLQDFAKSGPAEEFRATVYGLLGRALENAKRPAEAAAAYLDASEAADATYLKAEDLMDGARAYVNAKDTAKAIDTYRRLLKDYPKSSSKTEAEVRLAELTSGAM
jgi:outer membrane protein assembly factor BamD (BamD/ComL family)